MKQITTIGFGIVVAAGLLLSTSAFASDHEYEHYEHDYDGTGAFYYDEGRGNSCKGGLKVFAHLTGGEYLYGDELKISFSSGGYVKSKVIPATQSEVGYLFYEGTVPEYGEFKVTIRNLNSGDYNVVEGINSPECVPEYVSIEVPQ